MFGEEEYLISCRGREQRRKKKKIFRKGKYVSFVEEKKNGEEKGEKMEKGN